MSKSSLATDSKISLTPELANDVEALPTIATPTAPYVASKKSWENGDGPCGRLAAMDLNKMWEVEEAKVLEVLGQTGPRYKRTVNDVLTLEFTIEEWCKLFNVSKDYVPAENVSKKPFTLQTVVVSFVRQVEEKSG